MAYQATERTQAHKQQTRESLLQAGHRLVANGGFRALSMAALASRAGMATGNIYRYFADKAALSVALFERATNREIAAVFACVNERAAPDLQLEMLLTAFLQRALSNPRLAYALIAEPVHPAVEQARSRYRGHWASRFQSVIEDGIAEGVFAPQPAHLAATALVGAMAEPLAKPANAFHSADIAPLVQFCMRALRP